MKYLICFLFLSGLLNDIYGQIQIPRLEVPVEIDGNPDEWKDYAFHDGLWDIYRLRQSNWYEPGRNRLADHGEGPDLVEDLSARYYMAWDSIYLYLGAIVQDNVNDVTDPKHAPKRWYYKDAICWFIEAPLDSMDETFGNGNHGFAFVIDTTYPDYGAWWRHGNPDSQFIEMPLPEQAVDYHIQLDPRNQHSADYILEARIRMDQTFGASDPAWPPPFEGQRYSLMLVHCDPDGGPYGGHFLIYGKGDPDNSWTEMIFSPPIQPILRRDH